MARKRRGRNAEPNERPARAQTGPSTQRAAASSPPLDRSTRASATSRISWAWAAVAPLLAVVVFAQVAGFELLQYDDRTNVGENPHLNPVTMSGVARFWSAPYAGLYAPLTYTFFAAEALLAERPATASAPRHLEPWVFHLGNLLLHMGCVLLVFDLLRLLVGNNAAACAGACLFALHPLQAESVAWVTETKGLLAAFWGLAALLLYVRYAQASASREVLPVRTGVRPSGSFIGSPVWYYTAATAAFALALLSKPTAVAVPLVALVIDVGLLRRSWSKSMAAVLPWLAMAAVLVVATQRAQPAEALAIEHVELWQRPLVAADALLFYLRKLVWPWPLGPDYGRTPSVALGSLVGKLAWLALAALALVIRWLPGRRVAWTALAIFAAAIAPVSGLLPFGFQGMSTVADRYAYLGMLAPALLLAWGLSRDAPRGVWGAVSAVLVVLAAFSFWQTSLWHDDGTLFAHNLQRVNGESHVAFNNLGYALERRAMAASTPAERTALLQTAVEHFDRARQLRPEMDEAWQRLAYAQRRLGKLPEAEATFRQFLAQRPKSPTGHYNLGTLLAQQQRAAEAIVEFRAAIALRPDYANAWLELASQLAAERDLAAALDAFQQALATGRNSRAVQLKGHLGLAEIHLALGNRAAAIEAAQVAAHLAPQAPAVQALLRRLQADEAGPARAGQPRP